MFAFRSYPGAPMKPGEALSYSGKHKRIRNTIEAVTEVDLSTCVDCGTQGTMHLSNVDHLYSSDWRDYQPRCPKCHRDYDHA